MDEFIKLYSDSIEDIAGSLIDEASRGGEYSKDSIEKLLEAIYQYMSIFWGGSHRILSTGEGWGREGLEFTKYKCSCGLWKMSCSNWYVSQEIMLEDWLDHVDGGARRQEIKEME